jgi:hypothetical protein
VQIAQRHHGDSRVTKLHARTRGSIQHPPGNHLDRTASGIDVDYSASAALLNISNLDAVPIQRVPTIMDFNFVPDMGRMNVSEQ